MKIRITKEQARILENLNKTEVIKITQSQYKQLLESEGVEESALIKPIFNAISKVDAKAGSEYKRNVNSETKIKGVLHEDLWKEFVNELYGLNESGKNIYEKLIKLMEACGYVENRKISKTTFEGNKEMAKNVILSGLGKLHESGSAYMAMEAMDEAFKSEKKNPFFKTFVDDWFAKGNENLMVQKYYDNGDYWMAWQLIRRIGNVGKMPQNPSDMEVVSISEIDSDIETVDKVSDEIDTITMDVPLFLRALEYSREDAKTDLTLHDITQNAIKLSKEYDVLNMDNYNEIFGGDSNSETSAKPQPTELSEVDVPDGVVGLDILNHEPFKSLPETRSETGDYTTRMEPTLPSLDMGDARTIMFSKQDFVDHEVQGPKMMHQFDGYVTLFKKKFGEEPVFINFKVDGRRGSADIANEKFLQWKYKDNENKRAWLDAERSAGRTSGLDEKEIDEVTAMGGASPVFSGPGGFPVGKLKSVDEYNIYEALNTLKKKVETEEEQIDETGIGNVGAYDTPGFASSEFMGTAGKKGKAPVNKGITHKKTMIPGGSFVKENAFDKTQWAGGEFVEFDDCTKLNNNKEAQKGGCSTGAIDNVVKTKKTSTNVNAPSLGKKAN